MDNIAFVFPGQGTQHVTMGREFYHEFEVVHKIFDRAAEVLAFDIAKLCFEGPQEELDLTINTQVAILTMEIAVYELVRHSIPVKPRIMAGHSLGEYCAIYAAGALSLNAALTLVKARARYHQEALPVGVGSMATIIGLDYEDVQQICQDVKDKNEIVVVSLLNAPRHLTISGHTSAIEKVMIRARERKAKSVIKLPISVPCHCDLLDGASTLMKEELARVSFSDFQVPVIPNCIPDVFYTKINAPSMLQAQIKSPVRWQQTIEKMAALGIDTIVEIGPKKTLSNLIKRIDKRIHLLDIGDLESFRKAQAFFNLA